VCFEIILVRLILGWPIIGVRLTNLVNSISRSTVQQVVSEIPNSENCLITFYMKSVMFKIRSLKRLCHEINRHIVIFFNRSG